MAPSFLPWWPATRRLPANGASDALVEANVSSSNASSIGTIVLVGALLLLVGLLCRRWARKGAQRKKGSRLQDGESVLNDVNDWAIEEASLDHDASTEMFERDPDGRME